MNSLAHLLGDLQIGENLETYQVLCTLSGPGALAFWVGEKQIPGAGQGP